MLIAIAGLASSHPFTDARILSDKANLVVCDDDPARLAKFRAEHPAARVAAGLDELLAARPDGVVLTVPTPEVAQALGTILNLDLPCFVNKPAAASIAQLAALDDAVAMAQHRVLTSSVLRFAPDFTALAVEPAEVLAAQVTVRHDVGRWAGGHNPWQDDPRAGGGMLVTMGVHGVELLVALFGPDVRLMAATTATRRYRTLASEDTATLTLQWGDGITGTITFLGVTEEEYYEIVVHTPAGPRAVVLRGGADAEVALGYRATLAAFWSMLEGSPSPVPWEQTRAVLSALVQARELTS